MTRISAQQLISEILDPHSFISWDKAPHYGDISDDYVAALAKAREKSGVDEAVVTGEGTVFGTRVAFVLSEFAFLGGSIGAATARRIIDAIHRATEEQLPLLISPSSGGTRMQEGTPAFALMVSITTAVYRHKDAHLPFLVYLRNPTTGGVIAQDRHNQPPLAETEMGPAALRFARRGIALAHQLQIPLISIIDTTGAELSQAAEESGMAGSIARTLGELVDVDVPTVSVILGQGCGGGALAMLPADKVLAAANGWLSPLPPEGASAIIYRDTTHAPQMMQDQGVSAQALLEAGIIDDIIPEAPDAAEEPTEFIQRVIEHITHALWELENNPKRVGREQRFRHYERLADSLIGD